MPGTCVFCGLRPIAKTLEHVIPEWLITLTGPRGRTASFGLDYSSGSKHKFAFSSFKFPACWHCNDRWSLLEAATKPVFEAMLGGDRLCARDFQTLLDWFDKIRVGLWLGYMQMCRNPAGVRPRFYIQDRVGAADRMLILYQATHATKHLIFTPPWTRAYQRQPSCLGLYVNGLGFISISSQFLLAERLGLPYPAYWRMTEDGLIDCALCSGRLSKRYPPLAGSIEQPCTQLLQPVVPPAAVEEAQDRRLYETAYAREMLGGDAPRMGRLHVVHGASVVPYPTKRADWAPGGRLPPAYLRQVIVRTALRLWLKHFGTTDLAPGVSPGVRLQRRQSDSFCKYELRTLLDTLPKQLP